MSSSKTNSSAIGGASVLGFAIGGLLGFLLRPSINPTIGQLPLKTIITVGTSCRVEGADILLKGAAETSFNYMLAGAILGVIAGLVIGYFIKRTPAPKEKSTSKKLQPIGIISSLAGVLLFVYFVKKVGVCEILAGIERLGFGFVLILAVSSIRHIVRSLSWMLCFDGPERLRFWDALRARLMGDALGNIVGVANVLVSEPAKPAMIRDRVPLTAGISAIAIENIFYALSVSVFIVAGMTALLLNFNLPKPLRIAGLVTLAIFPILIAVLYIFIRQQYRFISGLLGFLHRRGLAERWLVSGRVVEDRVYGFYRRNGSRFLPILLLEACFHFAGVLEIYVTLSFISLGHAPTLFTAFILESVNRVINVAFKFVPLRMGVDEAGTGKVSAILQFTEATGVTLAIIRKARDVFWTIVGFLLLAHRGLSLRAAIKRADEAIGEAAQTAASAPAIPANGSS